MKTIFDNIKFPLLGRGLGGGLFLLLLFSIFSVSCEKDDTPVQTFDVVVQLAYPDGFEPATDVVVTLRNTITGDISKANTNANGAAAFTVIAGAYEVSATDKRSIGGKVYLFNGLQTGVTINDAWGGSIKIDLMPSETKQIVIKELYNGGVRKEDNATFQFDKYVILYNNSDEVASLQNLCLAMVTPPTAAGTNRDYVNGVLFYEAEGWIPAGTGIWTFQNNVLLDPGKQAVIAFNAAINHLPVIPNSINFANPEYFVTYDPVLYNLITYHPAPSEVIPTSHYLKGYKLPGVTSTGWTPAVNSPAFFVFSPKGVTPDAFANDASTIDLYNGSASQARQKVPVDWVVDGIEVFSTGTTSAKRLTATVDAGAISFTNYQGHTLYRNVDKEATEAVPGNAGKLVYSYSLGTEGSTDPSSIDAEASIKAGARIIYEDTNNSTNDFHVRSRASLRD
jgi:hypothetical protein